MDELYGVCIPQKSLKNTNELENLNKMDDFLGNVASWNYKVENMGEN